MQIVLLGAPGSGKITQAMALSEYFGISWITISQMLHDTADDESLPGMQAKAYLDMGQHVPDEIIYAVLKERLARPDIRNGFLLAGFPRTVHQAKTLDEILEQLNLPLDLVLLLEGDPDHFMERLEGRCFCQSCGAMYNDFSNPPKVEGMCNLCGDPVRRRPEDNEETIAHRIRSYEQQAEALIQYYRLHGKLRQVSAVGDSDKVYDALRYILESHPPTVVCTEPVIAAAVPITKKPAANNEKGSKQFESQGGNNNKKKTTAVKQQSKIKNTRMTANIKRGVKPPAPDSKQKRGDNNKVPIKNKKVNKSTSIKPAATKKKSLSNSTASSKKTHNQEKNGEAINRKKSSGEDQKQKGNSKEEDGNICNKVKITIISFHITIL